VVYVSLDIDCCYGVVKPHRPILTRAFVKISEHFITEDWLFKTESVIVEAIMHPHAVPADTLKTCLIGAHNHELGLVFLLLKYVRPDVIEELAKSKGVKLEFE
jgi:hypothetical protein